MREKQNPTAKKGFSQKNAAAASPWTKIQQREGKC